ncbi:MAG: PAS domain-containing protein [Thermoanaerobaculia bacterium]
MAPSTAISLLGLAAAAWLWQSRPASVAANRFGRIVALAVLAVSLLVWAYLQHEQSDARRIAAETVSVVADLKVDQIAEWYREHGALAVTISRTPLQAELQQFMTNPADIETRGRMLGWLWAIQQETGDSLAALVDSQGIVRLSVPSSMTSLDAHMLRDCRKALPQRTVVVQDLRRHQPDHTIRLSFVVPLVSDRSDVVLLLQIDAERSLFPLVESWPTRSPTAETFLVRREGNEVVYLNELRHRKGTALNLRMGIDQMLDLPAARAASGEEGVFEGNDYRQVPVVAALRAVPGTPWFMVAKIDREEIYAPFRRKVSMAALVLAVLLLTAISAISVLWYRRGLVSAERELVLQRRRLESERNFRALFEQAGVGVAQLDARSGRFLRVNRRYRDLLGYEEEELSRSTWKDITRPDDVASTVDNLQRLVEGETRELTMETRYLRKDGDVCWVSLTISPLWEPGDEPLHYIAVVQDITERKRAEAALMEQLEELRRWHEVTLGRETRILELKREVNQLLVEAGSPPRYVSPDVSSAEEPKP